MIERPARALVEDALRGALPSLLLAVCPALFVLAFVASRIDTPEAEGVASAILIESGLAFLGLGDPSVPSWGETLNAGRLEMKLWLILAPGLAIFFVVSVFNLVGEGLRDALDPKLRT